MGTSQVLRSRSRNSNEPVADRLLGGYALYPIEGGNNRFSRCKRFIMKRYKSPYILVVIIFGAISFLNGATYQVLAANRVEKAVMAATIDLPLKYLIQVSVTDI